MTETLQNVITEAFRAGATDVLLMEGEVPRLRISGVIVELDHEPIFGSDMTELWEECLADPTQVDDYDSSCAVMGIGRVRANLFKSLGRLAASLRPIRSEIPSFEELNLPAELLANWVSRRSGLVLVTGPTGSGKSTTLASALEWVNLHQSRHMVTIEDPIEYIFTNRMSYFSQRELHRDTDTFAKALRAALRQSPDIILLGEIRDPETAEIALAAAETGHLVLSTMHSSGVVDTLDRLSNILDSSSTSVGIAGLLSAQLIGILSQQLLPREDGGLQLVTEYMQNEGVLRSMIAQRRHAEISDIMERSSDFTTTRSMKDALIEAVNEGHIHQDVARAASHRPQDFDRSLRGIA